MKKIITAILSISMLLAISCKGGSHEEIVTTYEDGSPKLVLTVINGKNDTKTRIGEKCYYADGKTMYEKHFKDDKPCGTWTFNYPNGQRFAEGNFDSGRKNGSDWKFYTTDGNPYYTEKYDSLAVLEMTADSRPLSVAYYSEGSQMMFQFNDNYTLNAKGMVVDGLKEGRWEFYYANGQMMLESIFVNGIKNGAYNSYRETGIPYFRGFYINDQRAGIWEIYDEEGNLAGRQDFDKK